jgi:hypothetical protein
MKTLRAYLEITLGYKRKPFIPAHPLIGKTIISSFTKDHIYRIRDVYTVEGRGDTLIAARVLNTVTMKESVMFIDGENLKDQYNIDMIAGIKSTFTIVD